jgi:hypothetical protein
MPANPSYDQDSIIETLERVRIVLREYMPLREYSLYVELCDVIKTLSSRRDSERRRYQNKAEYHREYTRKWREDNRERNEAYQKQYYGKPCQCPERNMYNWCIVGKAKQLKPDSIQTYSIKCKACGAQWKTKAKYCKELKEDNGK